MHPVTPDARPTWEPVVIAKDQPEYIPLPANIRAPYVETKWKLTFSERLDVLFGGHIHLRIMTFGSALQPLKMATRKIEDDECHVSRINPHVIMHNFKQTFRRVLHGS